MNALYIYIYICIYIYINLRLFFKNYLLIYSWLCWVFIPSSGLSLVSASGVCSLVAVHRLLIALAVFVVDHRL